jgi:hypothetical protein
MQRRILGQLLPSTPYTPIRLARLLPLLLLLLLLRLLLLLLSPMRRCQATAQGTVSSKT